MTEILLAAIVALIVGPLVFGLIRDAVRAWRDS